jgi:hypothetical protein
MRLSARWLAVVGTIGLVVGLYLSIAGLTSRTRAGLVLLAGCLFWVAFLVINEPPRNGREPLRDTERDSGVPWGELWPFVAMAIIALGTLLTLWLLR